MDVPRPEHPRPQAERADWINLNGTWTFELDPGGSGLERGLPESKGFEREILVPFCPESELSGVGHRDFIRGMWYHRRIRPHLRLLDQPPIVESAQDAFVHKLLVQAQFPPGMEDSHLGAGPSSTGGTIHRPRRYDIGVFQCGPGMSGWT